MKIKFKHAITDSSHFIKESEVLREERDHYVVNYERINYTTGESLGFVESDVHKSKVTEIIN